MNREEHLVWAKQRALDYLIQDDLKGALGSFLSDMQKHEETKNHLVLELLPRMMFGGLLNTKDDIEQFIKGTN